MPRPTGGFVRLYRKIMVGSLRGDGHSQHVLNILVMMANRFPGTEPLRKQAITLDRGQLATSLHELVELTGFARSTIVRALERLRKWNVIQTQTEHSGTIVTIMNYDKYQATEDVDETQKKRKPDASEHAAEYAAATHIGDLRDTETTSYAKPKKPKLTKARQTTWDPTDPYAKVYGHLSAIPKYSAIFDVPKDTKTLVDHQTHYSLSVKDLEQVAYEFRHWMDGPNAEKVKSPRGTLATFVKRHAERKPPETQQGFDYSGYTRAGA